MRAPFIYLITAAGAFACGRVSSSDPASLPAIVLDSSSSRPFSVAVTGLAQPQLELLRKAQLSNAEWQRILRINVAGSEGVAMVGRYSVSDTALHFQPLFPFDAGRTYHADLDAEAAAAAGVTELPSLGADFTTAPSTAVASARIVRVLPDVDTVPANLLRIYVEFSAAMARESGLERARLLDSAGNEVENAFLPVEADFWSGDARRYTFFLDPGRVKRGILSNEELGRALQPGARYNIVFDSLWRDENGQPLLSSYTHYIRAGPPVKEKISMAQWRIRSPAAGGGSRDTLTLELPGPLDYGLMQRALGVVDQRGRAVAGDVAISPGQRIWKFVPHLPWRSGTYQLLVLGFLEDPSGNRIDRAFEVDMFERTERDTAPQRHTIPFSVR